MAAVNLFCHVNQSFLYLNIGFRSQRFQIYYFDLLTFISNPPILKMAAAKTYDPISHDHNFVVYRIISVL